ncbi:MarC family protein [Pseudanabaenaceae cyanobacterium LEGE 13415]|nr:MarC family protein [Pseudanabaenaceae cyanobacterium LEGE 13415]
MLNKALNDFLTLWVTIEPIGTVVLFASLSAPLSQTQRRKVALKAIVYSTIILLASIVVGQAILSAMQIQLLSLQVAGGLILLLFALQMIFGFSQDSPATPEKGHDIAVFPLAVPSIAGAEAIMAVVLLTDNHVHSIASQVITACVVVLIMSMTYGLMLLAEPILRAIGINGAAILERVTGMILAALAVELIMEALGVQRWIN